MTNRATPSITTGDSQNFTIKLKSGWTFSNGEKVTADSFINAWNYAALVTNKQINAPFFAYIDGYDKVHPASGSPAADRGPRLPGSRQAVSCPAA